MTTPKVSFNTLNIPLNANHNVVDDSNAVPTTSTELPACDQGQGLDSDLVQSHESNTEVTSTAYPAAGTLVAYVPTLDEHHMTAHLSDPYYPFSSWEKYNFTELVILQRILAGVIDKILKGNCGLNKNVCSFLKSNYHLRPKIDHMEDGLGHGSWKKSKLSIA